MGTVALEKLDSEGRRLLASIRDEALAELGSDAPPGLISRDLLAALTELYLAGQHDPERLKRYAVAQARLGIREREESRATFDGPGTKSLSERKVRGRRQSSVDRRARLISASAGNVCLSYATSYRVHGT
jgi:hypothetical protein